MRTLLYPLLLLAAGLAPALAADPPATPTPGPGPQEIMQKVSHDLLRDLDANRAALAKDRAQLRQLVDRHLLPHFDTAFAARRVLGKHWTAATPEQRKRFIDAFYGSLMADYGNALVEPDCATMATNAAATAGR